MNRVSFSRKLANRATFHCNLAKCTIIRCKLTNGANSRYKRTDQLVVYVTVDMSFPLQTKVMVTYFRMLFQHFPKSVDSAQRIE